MVKLSFMDHEKNNKERIENYLDGSFSQDEQKHFEEDRKINNELETQLKMRINLAKLWNDACEYDKVKKDISSAIKHSVTKTTPFFLTKPFRLAALLIILLGVSFIIINQKKNRITNNSLESATIDSTEIDSNKTYELKYDPIKNKASIKYMGDSIIGQIILKSPNYNSEIEVGESINFVWYSEYSEKATLFVTNIDSIDIIFYQAEILLSDTSMLIEGHVLQKGAYVWFINKNIKYGSFQIK